MLLQLVGFLLVGRLAVYLLQKFPFHFKEGGFLEQLFLCDLCLGVWLFTGLSFIMHVDFIKDMFGIYVPVINQFLTGAIASFVVHIFRIGWNTKFQIVEIN